MFSKKYCEKNNIEMDLYHQFQTAIIFANLALFIQINVWKFWMIIQNPRGKGSDEYHFVWKLLVLKIILRSLYYITFILSLYYMV